MAVDSPVQYNGWWVYLRDSMGSTHLNPSDKQTVNATLAYNGLISQGYSPAAAAGIVGNMQQESSLTPGALQTGHLSILPNNGEHLADLPNSVVLDFYDHNNPNNKGYGTGLCQWDRVSSIAPTGNAIASTAIRNTMNWYDGDLQLLRLDNEYNYDPSGGGGIGGVTYTFWISSNHSPNITWSAFKSFSGTPEEAADIWRQCWERSSGDPTGNLYRRDNARYWYDYFSGTPPTPPTPENWITGTDFASLAAAYDPDITGQDIPYSTLDCYGFVNKVWHDIPVVTAADKLINPNTGSTGTNSWWRQNMSPYPSWTFNTTSPDLQNPTPVLWVKDSISNIESLYGEIPPGTILFHQISESGPPAIPSQYAGDGIGNFAHVGIYIGNNEVMQSGGRDSSSVPGGGVHRSAYDSSAWNYAAFVVWVDCIGGSEPPEPPMPSIYQWLYMWYATKKKRRLTKNVKRSI